MKLALVLMCGLLAGCNAVIGDINKSRLNSSVQVGMSRGDLIKVMGNPEKREAYGETEFLLYRTAENVYDELGLTPVAVIDGKVAGWGRNYYTNAIKADVTVRHR